MNKKFSLTHLVGSIRVVFRKWCNEGNFE